MEDEERARRQDVNAKRAAKRAEKELRLYIVANVLTRMWTLTYRDAQWDRCKVTADVNDWLQRLRVHLEERFPASYVIELHPDGHGLHVHVALQSRFIQHRHMAKLWGKGLVQYGDGNKGIRKVRGKRAKARSLAAYLCKYMAKAWDELHAPGDHRYERTQGFGVEKRRRVFRTLIEALHWLDQEEGAAPVTRWHSGSVDDWYGPPCWISTYD